MPSSRDAWLAVFAAVLGVSEEACKREATSAPMAVHDAPSATASAIVATTAPSASVEPAAPSASAVASASATPKKTDSQAEQTRKMIENIQAVCGAVPPNRLSIGNASCGASVKQDVQTPTANVAVHASGTIAGDDPVVALLRPRARNCANRGLAQNPDEHGKLLVNVAIAANGDVTSTTVAQNSGLAEGTAQCMARSMRYSAFPTSSGPRTIQVTVVTQKQN